MKRKNQNRRKQALLLMLAVLAVCVMPLMDKGLKHYTKTVLERNTAVESEYCLTSEKPTDSPEEGTDETEGRETEHGTDTSKMR